MLSFKLICSLLPSVCVSYQAIGETYQSTKAQSGPIPTRCQPYIQYFHNSSNPSRELAQTEQESGCNRFAQSAYAKGLRQFTDRTGEWLSMTHCKHLGDYKPFNEKWSIKCGLIYMQLLEKNNDFGSYCFNRMVAEAEYNGGSWVIWEMNATGNVSLAEAKKICGTKVLPNGRKRAKWACEENYDYPNHISRRQTSYAILGGDICK